MGQLGTGTTNPRTSPTPLGVSLTWSLIVAGGGSTCGATTGSRAYCWGDNLNGQLGNGTASTSGELLPTAVVGP